MKFFKLPKQQTQMYLTHQIYEKTQNLLHSSQKYYISVIQIILYININMKTINVGLNGKGKSVKKVLVNRSRSGNHVPVTSRIDQPRTNVSPFRNSIGLRKIQQPTIKRLPENKNTLNQDYYQKEKQPEIKRKFEKKGERVLNYNYPYTTQESVLREKEMDKKIDDYFGAKTQNTAQNSKFTGQNSSKMQFVHSDYMVTGYLSPGVKLRTMQKQKINQKQTLHSNLQKIIKAEQNIKQNRNRYAFQSQLYQQIISNLKKQAKMTKSSLFLQSKLSKELKHSGSMQTEQGESSNQY